MELCDSEGRGRPLESEVSACGTSGQERALRVLELTKAGEAGV